MNKKMLIMGLSDKICSEFEQKKLDFWEKFTKAQKCPNCDKFYGECSTLNKEELDKILDSSPASSDGEFKTNYKGDNYTFSCEWCGAIWSVSKKEIEE